MLACYYPQGKQLASGVIALLTCQSHYNVSVINTTPCIQCTYRTHNLQPGKTPPQVSADHIFFPVVVLWRLGFLVFTQAARVRLPVWEAVLGSRQRSVLPH